MRKSACTRLNESAPKNSDEKCSDGICALASSCSRSRASSLDSSWRCSSSKRAAATKAHTLMAHATAAWQLQPNRESGRGCTTVGSPPLSAAANPCFGRKSASADTMATCLARRRPSSPLSPGGRAARS
eukprot:2429228-Prymnesium_polylepis.1